MQLLVDALGEGPADPFDAGEVVNAGSKYPLQSTEMIKEPLAPPRAHRRDFLQARGRARLAAARAMAGDGEAVRLVADLLDEVQRRVIGRQALGLFLARDEGPFHAGLAPDAFGHADHAAVVQAEIRHHRARCVELADAASDEDQVRRLALAVR